MRGILVFFVVCAPLLSSTEAGAQGTTDGSCPLPEEPPIVLTEVKAWPAVGTSGIVLGLTFRNTDIVPHVRTFHLQYFRKDEPTRMREVGTLEVSLAAGEVGTVERPWLIPGPGRYHMVIGANSFDLDATATPAPAPATASPTTAAQTAPNPFDIAVERIELREVAGVAGRYLILIHMRNPSEVEVVGASNIYVSYASKPSTRPALYDLVVEQVPPRSNAIAILAWRPELAPGASDTVTLTAGNATLTRAVSMPPTPPLGKPDGDATVTVTGLRVEAVEGPRNALLVLVDAAGGTTRGKLSVPIEAIYTTKSIIWGETFRKDAVGEARFDLGAGERASDFAVIRRSFPADRVTLRAGPIEHDITSVGGNLSDLVPLSSTNLRVTPAARQAGERVTIEVEVTNPAAIAQDGYVVVIASGGPKGPGLAADFKVATIPPQARVARTAEFTIPAGATELRFTSGGQVYIYPVGKPALACYADGASTTTPATAPAPGPGASVDRSDSAAKNEPGPSALMLVAACAALALARRRG